jgi:multicomponent Na+:H+ antiporter subunit D
MLLGGVAASMGTVKFERIQGLAQRMPLTSFGLVICGLSLIGVPGTAGFISKWVLIQAALELGQWWVVLLVLGSSLLAVVYVWRFVEAAYFNEPSDALPGRGEGSWAMLLPSLLLVAATVYFGFDTRLTLGGATQAAELLMSGISR